MTTASFGLSGMQISNRGLCERLSASGLVMSGGI